MINYEAYKVFYFVAKFKNISRAAEALYISQPAVSQAIIKLEEALGGCLFYRTPRGVVLTAEGEVLFTYVSKGVESFEEAEYKFKALLTLELGEVRIGASDMTLQYYLLPHLETFKAKYPKVKIKVSNSPTPETLDALRLGKIDFAVVSGPVEEVVGLKIIPVARVQDVFVANDQFAALRGREIDLCELEQYPIICLEEKTSTRSYIDRFFEAQGVKLNPEFELATSDLIVQFAQRSLGIGCVVKAFAQEQLENLSLFEVKLKIGIPERDLYVVFNDNMPISPAGKVLLAMLVPLSS